MEMGKLAYGIKTNQSTLTQTATEVMLVDKITPRIPPGQWWKEMDNRRTYERMQVTHHHLGTARLSLLLLKWRIIYLKPLLLMY